MRYSSLVILGILFSSPVLAQSVAGSSSNTNAVTSSGASIVNNIPGYTKSNSFNQTTASAFAPGLTAAGINSCAGSVSGGVGGTGFNFGIGGTYEMEECTARANAAALAGIGQGLAALESLCQSSRMKAALNASGTLCPSQRAEYIAAQERANSSGQLYVAQELVEQEPPAIVQRHDRKRDRKVTRAAIAAQTSNSGASISQSSNSYRNR